VLRLLPGAIDAASTEEESFADGLLEYPQYTRPAVFEGRGVPPILTSGDHGAVRRWRHLEALRRTLDRRPDLLAERTMTAYEETLLAELAGPPDGRAILRRRSSRTADPRTPISQPALPDEK
jgi:tRNA (guanine37-N1)-methyltransferase